MRPDVNPSVQHFLWQSIQFEELQEFLWNKIGWTGDDLRTHTYGGIDKWNEFVREKYGG